MMSLAQMARQGFNFFAGQMDQDATVLAFAVKAWRVMMGMFFSQEFIATTLAAINGVSCDQSVFQHTVQMPVDGGG